MSSDIGQNDKKNPGPTSAHPAEFTQSGTGEETRIATLDGLAPPRSLLALVQITAGPEQGKIVQIPSSGRFLVGRGRDCSLMLHDRSCSRQHVEIWHESGDTYKLRDLGSTNGTRINDVKVEGLAPLKNGDRIQIGDNAVLRFTLVTESEGKAQIDVYHKATRDPLTNVANRRIFEDILGRELGHQQRSSPELFLILMDIDFFKKINDNFGHAAGDQVLKDFCRKVEASIRAEDTIARLGGEEFGVVGRCDGTEGLATLAERIRKNVEKTPTLFEGRQISYTVSLGCVLLSPKPRLPSEELYQRADECLYEAKKGGRNRHVLKVLSP